ncbi:MAG TPA: O-methyltransferase [Deltaproteobacteria bacterium]|nr:O-methyltransferase [Deltaproteobacteria bacterium]
MEFPSPEINAYLHELTPERSEVFSEIEALAAEQNFPIIGPLVGRLLYQLVKISGARHVFELGSGYAYSALWMALALPEGGQVICTELDKAKAELGMKFLESAKLRHKVIYEVGKALDSFARYQGPFDLIFCDLNKHEYPKALEMGVSRLKPGGLFIADNVLWSGRVLDPDDRSPETKGIREFNEKLYAHPELFSTILPIRDGVSVSWKVEVR